jgi:hypothetical protein
MFLLLWKGRFARFSEAKVGTAWLCQKKLKKAIARMAIIGHYWPLSAIIGQYCSRTLKITEKLSFTYDLKVEIRLPQILERTTLTLTFARHRLYHLLIKTK